MLRGTPCPGRINDEFDLSYILWRTAVTPERPERENRRRRGLTVPDQFTQKRQTTRGSTTPCELSKTASCQQDLRHHEVLPPLAPTLGWWRQHCTMTDASETASVPFVSCINANMKTTPCTSSRRVLCLPISCQSIMPCSCLCTCA